MQNFEKKNPILLDQAPDLGCFAMKDNKNIENIARFRVVVLIGRPRAIYTLCNQRYPCKRLQNKFMRISSTKPSL